jgi:hypothetical protein
VVEQIAPPEPTVKKEPRNRDGKQQKQERRKDR